MNTNIGGQSDEATVIVQQKLTESFADLVEPIKKADEGIETVPKSGITPQDLVEPLK